MAKGPNAFRTISEAADELGVPQHVLRFWETRFTFLKPMKRAGGRRFYRPNDILLLKGVKALLYTEGFKIEGVQKLYREEGVRRLLAAAGATVSGSDGVDEPGGEAGANQALSSDARRRLNGALEALVAAKARLDQALADR